MNMRDRKQLEEIILSYVSGQPDLVPRFFADWTIQESASCVQGLQSARPNRKASSFVDTDYIDIENGDLRKQLLEWVASVSPKLTHSLESWSTKDLLSFTRDVGH
jgi:hypothetical protein